MRQQPGAGAQSADGFVAGSGAGGSGIELAARARGLGFVPLLQERYHLVCLKSALEQPPIQALRRLLQDASWQQALAALAGYLPSDCGRVLALNKVLPWWDFAKTAVKKSQKPDDQAASIGKVP